MVRCLSIVKHFLKENGYTGLCNTDNQCGCSIKDLNPCGESISDCLPAYETIGKCKSCDTQCDAYNEYENVKCYKIKKEGG